MAKKQKDSKRKAFESKYDSNRLREMINEGRTADEIQEELAIVSKQSLRQHVLKLINQDRQFYEVPGLYVRNLKRPMVNFKGEIRLTKKMIDFPGSTYQHNDQFEIDADNEKIILTRVTNLPDDHDEEPEVEPHEFEIEADSDKIVLTRDKDTPEEDSIEIKSDEDQV